MGEQLRVVGQPVARVDAFDKLVGAARYSSDLTWPDTLHGAVVRSTRAHAVIVSVDVAEALRCPGVQAVVTAADLGGIAACFGHHRADQPILAVDKVRYWGEPIAVVLATTRELAQDALEHVDVQYDELPALMSVHDAMREGAELIHEDWSGSRARVGPCEPGRPGTNEAFHASIGWGDVDAMLAQADHRVTTRNQFPMLYAYPMEPHNAQARFVDGVLEVVSSAQHPFQVQRELSRVFGMSISQVRVSAPLLGGGYGSKAYTKLEPLAAACSRAVGGRPVKVLLDLAESIYTTRVDSALVEVTSGFTADGLLLARDVRIVLDTGAYTHNSAQVLWRSTTRGFGPYRIPAVRVRSSAVYTTTAPADSYRGFGTFHTNTASELNLDRAAAELGIDPIDIRLLNLVKRGEELVPGLRPMDADLGENLRLVRDRLRTDPKPGMLSGMAVSCGASDSGGNPLSMATVRIHADGSVALLTGSVEMGQGSRTALAQIVAEELDVDLSSVIVGYPDTRTSPFQWSTGASRTTTIAGLSVQRACEDVRRQLIELAAAETDRPAESFRWEDGSVVDEDGVSSTPTEVLGRWFGEGWGEVIGQGRVVSRGEMALQPAFWEIGMVGVAVDVDPETGQTQVDQLVTVADVGRAVNHSAIEGQEYGASTQGIGGALFEELHYEGPQIVNANLVEYRVPRISDAPRRAVSEIIERGDGTGPYGIKGVGEGAMTTSGGAVFAAVSHAIGRWPERGPLTPERVWSLLHAQASDEAEGPSEHYFPDGLFD